MPLGVGGDVGAATDTPKISGSAVLQWKHNLGDGPSLYSTLEANYTGARTTLPFGINGTLITTQDLMVHLPGYATANFRFGIKGERDSGSRWNATVFVKNFTNNHVLVDPAPSISLQTSAFERFILNQPLTAGIDVSYSLK